MDHTKAILARRAQLVAAAIGVAGCGADSHPRVCLAVMMSPCRSSDHVLQVQFAEGSPELIDPHEQLGTTVRWAKDDRGVRIRVANRGDELHHARVQKIVAYLRDAGVIHEHIATVEDAPEGSPGRVLVVSTCED